MNNTESEERELSGTQRFFKTVFPASWATSMEKESREWRIRCENCQFEKSVWEYGGIRWKASGNPVRKMTCQKCSHFSTHTVYRKEV